jgi:hypothetical protein
LPICDGGQLIGICERIQLSVDGHSDRAHSIPRRREESRAGVARKNFFTNGNGLRRSSGPETFACGENVAPRSENFARTKYFHDGMRMHHQDGAATNMSCRSVRAAMK